jgi:hypothetical protein
LLAVITFRVMTRAARLVWVIAALPMSSAAPPAVVAAGRSSGAARPAEGVWWYVGDP